MTASLVATAINPVMGLGSFLAQAVLRGPLHCGGHAQLHGHGQLGRSGGHPQQRHPFAAAAAARLGHRLARVRTLPGADTLFPPPPLPLDSRRFAMKVAVVQMCSSPDVSANLQAACQWIEQAGAQAPNWCCCPNIFVAWATTTATSLDWCEDLAMAPYRTHWRSAPARRGCG